MDRAATDYDADFYTCTQEQADALRRALMRVMEHLLKHLLKHLHSPAQDPRADWQVSVVKHRREAQRHLKRNPGLKGKLADLLAEAWTDARALAAASLETYDGVAPETLPAECPWAVEEVLGER